jgi:transcriptional regulator with XRE-family HTH domain
MNKVNTITNVKTLAERLIYARTLRGLSQQKLAKLAKCAQGTIGNAESGTRKTLRNLHKVARVLNCDPDWLFDGRGQAPSKSDVSAYATQVTEPNIRVLVPEPDSRQQRLMDLWQRLNDKGKDDLLEWVEIFVEKRSPHPDGQALSVAKAS